MTDAIASKIAPLCHQIESGNPIVLVYDPAIAGLEESIGSFARSLGQLYLNHGFGAVKMTFGDGEEGLVVVTIGPVLDEG